MTTVGTIAAVIAAIASLCGIAYARYEVRVNELKEVVEATWQLKHDIEFGGNRAKSRHAVWLSLGRTPLPAVVRVLDEPLNGISPDSAAAALEEAENALRRATFRRYVWRRLQGKR